MTKASRQNRAGSMGRRMFALAGLLLAGFFCSGCAQIKDYSIRSYQGPLPVADQQYLAESL